MVLFSIVIICSIDYIGVDHYHDNSEPPLSRALDTAPVYSRCEAVHRGSPPAARRPRHIHYHPCPCSCHTLRRVRGLHDLNCRNLVFINRQIPRAVVVTVLEPIMDTVVEYLLASACPCRIPTPLSGVPSQLALISTVLGSKPVAQLEETETETLAAVILRACVQSLGSDMRPSVHFIAYPGKAPSQSQYHVGILLDVPSSIDSIRGLLPITTHLTVALFSASLAGDLPDPETSTLPNIITIINSSTDYSAVNVPAFVAQMVAEGVTLVICQKVVHPTLQHALSYEGIVTIERTGIGCIDALTGSTS